MWNALRWQRKGSYGAEAETVPRTLLESQIPNARPAKHNQLGADAGAIDERTEACILPF